VPLHANVFAEASIWQTCFTISLWLTRLLSIRLGLFISQACSEDVFNFFQKQTYDSYRFIPELMDVFLWLVFTSNLISQTTG